MRWLKQQIFIFFKLNRKIQSFILYLKVMVYRELNVPEICTENLEQEFP